MKAILRMAKADEIKSVFTQPQINKSISDDHSVNDEYVIDDDGLAISILVDDELAAMVLLLPQSTTTYELHPAVLPKFRRYRFQLWRCVVHFIADEFPIIHKLNVKIPVYFRHVYLTAKAMGFIDEGLELEGRLIDGKFNDIYILGQTIPKLLKGFHYG